jgi:hypothetical protein
MACRQSIIAVVRSMAGCLNATLIFSQLIEGNRIERAPVIEAIKRQPKEIFLTALARTEQQVRRGDQGEKRASIRVRKCRRVPDRRRA